MARSEQEKGLMPQPHNAQELESALKEIMAVMLESVPDGYGRILRAVSEMTRDPVITQQAVSAYRDELAEVLEESPALPGVH